MCDPTKKPNKKPIYELQDIFNLYGDTYTSNNNLTFTQQKAIKDIATCRNRNCPKCQQQKRFQWIEKRLETTIDIPYYHTVFTVPNQLFDIAIYYQKIFYALLFKCSSDTLTQFAQELKWCNIDSK